MLSPKCSTFDDIPIKKDKILNVFKYLCSQNSYRMQQVITNDNSLTGNDNTIKRLFTDVYKIIDSSRRRVASTVNNTIVMMYWHVGNRVNIDVLQGERADYGKQIVSRLATQLNEAFETREFNTRNLRRMMQFARQLPDEEIVSRLATQLSWSHFVEVLPLKDNLQREFYITMAASEGWTRDTMRSKIDDMMYERTAISGKPDMFIKGELARLRDKGEMSPDLVFKNPYFLDFTGLHGAYSEHDLEDMLVASLERFLMELGNGFTFVERQKRMIIDGEDFKLDLLFYHRKLHRLIAIDLKRTKFKAQYKGQMELYLRYLDKYERQDGEESPLGLLLCSEGGDEQIELLQLDQSGIKVAQYLTELPNKELLREHLRLQQQRARLRMENLYKQKE